jgi:hypothetical protein
MTTMTPALRVPVTNTPASSASGHTPAATAHSIVTLSVANTASERKTEKKRVSGEANQNRARLARNRLCAAGSLPQSRAQAFLSRLQQPPRARAEEPGCRVRGIVRPSAKSGQAHLTISLYWRSSSAKHVSCDAASLRLMNQSHCFGPPFFRIYPACEQQRLPRSWRAALGYLIRVQPGFGLPDFRRSRLGSSTHRAMWRR